MSAVLITGTDTGIGKTIFAAGVTKALKASYWKPVQSGLEGETDRACVARLSGQNTLPEAYRLKLPASPHLSAEAEGVEINPEALQLPQAEGLLVVEGAGGVCVPLNRKILFLDIFSTWGAPVILCARTTLGTINHTLLSLKALKEAGCPVLGVGFIGEPAPEVEETICAFGQVAHLGRLPILPKLTGEALAEAFEAHIEMGLIREALCP